MAIALSNLSIYYNWKHIKSSYNNNKFKISAPTWNDEFELPDESYSVSDIQDYFEYILKKTSGRYLLIVIVIVIQILILISSQYRYM